MISHDFRPRGVCSQMMHIELSDDGSTIEQLSVEGGCGLLEGNTCGPRGTSCADQLTRGLREAASQAPRAASGDVGGA